METVEYLSNFFTNMLCFFNEKKMYLSLSKVYANQTIYTYNRIVNELFLFVYAFVKACLKNGLTDLFDAVFTDVLWQTFRNIWVFFFYLGRKRLR